ncbi:hypothetical protein P692DRAFT_20824341 [Suillus brevipes Sb2]|nr:hypothetical protein P692DRAFT_20824341 [Suillus brevipes Sb2]
MRGRHSRVCQGRTKSIASKAGVRARERVSSTLITIIYLLSSTSKHSLLGSVDSQREARRHGTLETSYSSMNDRFLSSPTLPFVRMGID